MAARVVELKYKRHALRVLVSKDGVWIAVADIARVLSYDAPGALLVRLPSHERDTRQMLTGPRIQVVTPSGLERLARSSRKPGAFKFLDWFRAEGMPQIALALQETEADAVATPLLGNALSEATDLSLETHGSFLYDNLPVRVQVDAEGEILFNANDVCQALELSNSRKALDDHVDPEDVTRSDTLTAGGVQQANYVNLSGLYALVFGSKKDAARKFKRWVTHEVLPSIQKTGQYSLQPESPTTEHITSGQTEALRLARVASAAALSASLSDFPGAAQELIRARSALARISDAEQELRQMTVEIQFSHGLDRPIASTGLPESMQQKERRGEAGKAMAGRVYIMQFDQGNLDRPRVRTLQFGEYLLKADLKGVKFLANQSQFGLQEWLEIEEWARKKVLAEKNRA